MPPAGRRQWTCTYCNVTINDDAPSRAQHERGLRHRSSVQRAIRAQYARAQEAKRTAEAQAREMRRLDAAARRAVGARPAPPASAVPPASGGKGQYGSLLQDQLVRRQQRGAAQPGPVAAEGVPGAWQSVPCAAAAPPPAQGEQRRRPARTSARSAGGAGGRAEPQERSDARAFPLRERRAEAAWDEGGDELVLGLREVLPAAKRARIQLDRGRGAPVKRESPVSEADTEAEAEVEVQVEAGGEREGRVVVKQEPGEHSPAEEAVGADAGPAEPAQHVAQTQEHPVDAPPDPDPSAAPGGRALFKKRKAGTGRGTKRIIV